MIKYKYAMKKLIYLSTLLFLFVLPMMAQQPLFPTPAKVQNGEGSFVIGKNLQVQGNGGYADKLAAALPAELKEAGLQSSPASGTIRLQLTNDCKMADEAYTLVVEPNSILPVSYTHLAPGVLHLRYLAGRSEYPRVLGAFDRKDVERPL